MNMAKALTKTLPRVLIVEDDKELASLTQDYLIEQGYAVEVEHNGIAAVEKIRKDLPDLVILDLMLPGIDGMEVCRSVRNEFHNPILILTAKTDQIDHILGLEMGADDYISKPVEPRLLAARVKALLRRSIANALVVPSSEDDQRSLEFDGLVIYDGARSVTVDGQEVLLTAPEYDLLWLLAENAGKILSRELIFQAIRGISYDGHNRIVDIAISQIRAKIDSNSNSSHIKTVRNKGYMFVRNINI